MSLWSLTAWRRNKNKVSNESDLLAALGLVGELVFFKVLNWNHEIWPKSSNLFAVDHKDLYLIVVKKIILSIKQRINNKTKILMRTFRNQKHMPSSHNIWVNRRNLAPHLNLFSPLPVPGYTPLKRRSFASLLPVQNWCLTCVVPPA